MLKKENEKKRAFNFCGTTNNPKIDIHQFLELAKAADATACMVQLEKGDQGTLHH